MAAAVKSVILALYVLLLLKVCSSCALCSLTQTLCKMCVDFMMKSSSVDHDACLILYT